jgi:hypothetical protein
MSSIDFFINPYGAPAFRKRSSGAIDNLPARSSVFSQFQGQPQADGFSSQATLPVNQSGRDKSDWNKPGWLRSFATAGAGYVAGRQLLNTAGVRQQPAGWTAHLGRVGALTLGVKAFGNYNPFARTSNGAVEPASPDWLMNLLTFGGTIAGLLFLCKRFDFAALLSASSAALGRLRSLPVFSRLWQVLDKLKEAPAAKPNPAFPSAPVFG